MTAALLLCSVIAVNADLARGHEAFQALRYERALEDFTQALATAETPAERVEVYLWIGMTRFELGDEAKARQAFRDALALDRKAELSSLASPKIEAAFTDERARLAVSDTAPPVVAQPAASTVSTVAPAPAVRWPTLAAGGAAVGVLTTAVIVGLSARHKHDEAEQAAFASDARALDASAHARGRTANVLYGVGAALGVVTLVYTVAF
jgi:tetratricopeptide (TPR) repeat protein